MSHPSWLTGDGGSMSMCCQCGVVTSAGRLGVLGRYWCDECQRRLATTTEATRLAAVQVEVAERAVMWCLPAA